jgi:hypothetical protein
MTQSDTGAFLSDAETSGEMNKQSRRFWEVYNFAVSTRVSTIVAIVIVEHIQASLQRTQPPALEGNSNRAAGTTVYVQILLVQHLRTVRIVRGNVEKGGA